MNNFEDMFLEEVKENDLLVVLDNLEEQIKMADKINKSAGRGKGGAFAKWAKIDKDQRNMLIAVCLTSIVLGVTVVGVIYVSCGWL